MIQLILGLLFVGAFIGLAPRFLKVLVVIDIVLVVVGYIGLYVLALLFSATKGKKNAGLFGDEAGVLVFMMFSIPALMVLGIVLGLLVNFASKKKQA